VTLMHNHGISHAVMSAVSGLQGEISDFGTSRYLFSCFL
jgi:hypothetical protein